jgi:putative transposase
VTGVMFHTDQGGEYAGEVFKRACNAAGVTRSEGRTGSALDTRSRSRSTPPWSSNALPGNTSRPEQARRAVAGWIDEYNTMRRHSTDGCSAQSSSNAARPRPPPERRSPHEDSQATW